MQKSHKFPHHYSKANFYRHKKLIPANNLDLYCRRVKHIEYIECFIAKRRNKQIIHQQKWEPLKKLLTL